MGFPWKQFAKIGLNVAGATVGGPLPALVRESQKHLAQPDDDDQGHDYVALGIRQIIGASFPKALLPLDNIALSWASIAAQDHKEEEEEDNMEDDAGSSIDIIKHFEGWRDKPYLCPAGEWTIGFGRNFEAAPFTNVEKQELRLLDGGDYSYRPEQEKRSTKGTNLIDLAGRDWDRNPLSKDEGNYLLKGFYETCAEQADVLFARSFFSTAAGGKGYRGQDDLPDGIFWSRQVQKHAQSTQGGFSRLLNRWPRDARF